MGIAFMVIAVIGLLSLSSSSGVMSRQPTPTNNGYQGPPQPWTPNPPSTFGVPMVPSTSSNVSGQIFSGAGQIGTQVGQQAIKSSGLSGLGATAATAGIAAGVSVLVTVAMQLLQAHAARLKGAKNENQAVDQYVPVFDSFVSSLVKAYNAQQCTAQEAATAAQQFDRYIYNAFRGLVGAPGTSWNDSSGMIGKCDKTCTVGCCVYFGDIGPVLNNISYVLGFPTGKWGQGDPRISGRTITVPKVYPSKYSSLAREMYSVTLN